ncbi:MAG: twin-arginine translocation signal domain-containing protein [Planctomycetes bacterium]|nr:twin-arginine translocation signal domain-containing protein [Planctomycetota bacterium]
MKKHQNSTGSEKSSRRQFLKTGAAAAETDAATGG